jgi:hypothetical protein
MEGVQDRFQAAEQDAGVGVVGAGLVVERLQPPPGVVGDGVQDAAVTAAGVQQRDGLRLVGDRLRAAVQPTWSTRRGAARARVERQALIRPCGLRTNFLAAPRSKSV